MLKTSKKTKKEDVILAGFLIPAYVEEALVREGEKDERKKTTQARKVLKDWADTLGYSDK